MGLLISGEARSRLAIRREPWVLPGKIRLPDFRAARLLAGRVREDLEASGRESSGVSAGSVHALALIDDALKALVLDHLERRDRGFLERSFEGLEKNLGAAGSKAALAAFSRDLLDLDDLAELPRRTALLEALLMWAQQGNPAATQITGVLHDSRSLRDPKLLEAIERLSQTRPTIGDPAAADEATVWEILLAPQQASPDSLLGQLQYLRRRWGDLLDPSAIDLQAGLDLFAEEMAPRLPPGPGPVEIPAPRLGDDDEAEPRYSSDRDWMPSLVLMAKNVYVWLDQLSTDYADGPLRHLDEIPDSELERLAASGFTGLWLIGVWERSEASRTIKRRCGNPEAEASAYSLRRYQIAQDLGGEPALERLREKARRHGIRLAADMVPNHMGIDSDWVLDHPERFISTTESPFPSYTFDGPDLSPRESVGLFIEDHYYNRSDAAVVFKRVHYGTGEIQYVYHGNDGTSMPWNDTAQLDYLDAEVREEVIRTILDVARRFQVIRFDAAMTLAKRHFQRLWFPEPGTAGAIPSRSERGLSREEFHRLMPEEFWREVVDRVAEEVPETLLLAEAFWLMEGYFVRTLGMHRVYNSAFMNMLRDERNAEYRRLLKETLVYDSRILQRYVNFISNPDEETAIEQFGAGDRYFGVCALMATLPGLPMFAHGQLEGFAEKYGMEYRRAYRDETANGELLARHEREIAPLLHRRELFAGVEKFHLYDLVADDGTVDENVFAYSNGIGDERILVLFNNRFGHARGRILRSSPAASGDAASDGRGPARLVESSLGECLGLPPAAAETFVTFRDAIAGLDFLADSRELAGKGLEIELGAFEYRVLGSFGALRETPGGACRELVRRLRGSGVPDLEQALEAVAVETVNKLWRAEVEPLLEEVRDMLAAVRPAPKLEEDLRARLGVVLEKLAGRSSAPGQDTALRDLVSRALDLFDALVLWSRADDGGASRSLEDYSKIFARNSPFQTVALVWLALSVTSRGLGRELAPTIGSTLEIPGVDVPGVERLRAALDRGLALGWGQVPAAPPAGGAALLRELLADEVTRDVLEIHRYGDDEFLNRESLETLLHWRLAAEILAWTAKPSAAPAEIRQVLGDWLRAVLKIEAGAAAVGYRTHELADRLEAKEKRPRG